MVPFTRHIHIIYFIFFDVTLQKHHFTKLRFLVAFSTLCAVLLVYQDLVWIKYLVFCACILYCLSHASPGCYLCIFIHHNW